MAKIFGEAFQEKYTSEMKPEAKLKIANAVRFLQSAPQVSAAFVAYGIGVIAQNAGDSFASCSELCLTSLKAAVEFAITPKISDKKDKLQMYHHARDNAIASIGKVIKYQTALV